MLSIVAGKEGAIGAHHLEVNNAITLSFNPGEDLPH
jgi:hypothetical protein